MEKEHFYSDCRTICDLLIKRSRINPEENAFFSLDNNDCWQPINWSYFARNAKKVGVKLHSAGINKGEYVGIIAPTSPNWEYTQMGALSVASIVVGIDQHYPPDQLSYILGIIGLSALFVQDREILGKIPPEIRDKIKLIIIFEGNPQYSNECSIDEVLSNNEIPEDKYKSIEPLPEDGAVMVLTSGTTGLPKAIVFSHKQVIVAVKTILDVFDDIEADATLLCWMPLANLFQRVINFCAISKGITSYIINNPKNLMDYVSEVNPDILIGVPKVFEKIQAGIMEQVKEKMLINRWLIQWALRVGYNHIKMKRPSTGPGLVDKLSWLLADKIILRYLRAIFGSRIRYLVSGSAAMPVWLLEWFEAIGLPVLEAYGISENIIPNAINRFSERKLGTVGKPLPPNQIVLAPDGEILVRGPGIFRGYVGGKNKAIEGLTKDNYWHTGDLGFIDEEGYLSLSGRKSEVFKTSGGKWVNPVQIEAQLKHVNYIEDSLVFPSDSGKIMTILSIDEFKFLNATKCTIEKDQAVKKSFQDINTEKLQADLELALQVFPVYQRPSGVIVTTRGFSILSGELTVNMKLRRKVIISHFVQYIDELENVVLESGKNHDRRLQILVAQ